MIPIDLAPDDPFGLANLPYGVFSTTGTAQRPCVRVGDQVLDLAVLDDPVCAGPTLNPLLAAGADRWAEVRGRLRELLVAGRDMEPFLHPLDEVRLHLPVAVADYVDFYASEHHARNVGRIFRPDGDALTPNWTHLPIGYHGRAGSIVVSGTDIVRPAGQRRASGSPEFGPSVRLDIEAELGFVIGGGTAHGHPVPIEEAEAHIFGICLVNDWSARDIQAWEYVPLGPFLGKSFATSVSPWIVPFAALDAARTPPPPRHHELFPYLDDPTSMGLDIDLEIRWNDHVVSRPPVSALYWTPAQLVAHTTVNGAALRAGDLLASGTVSGPRPDQFGSFLELTWNGERPLTLLDGTIRSFLDDGDEVVISGAATGADGARIGLGEVEGRIRPNPAR